jgi:hypothetical protein
MEGSSTLIPLVTALTPATRSAPWIALKVSA